MGRPLLKNIFLNRFVKAKTLCIFAPSFAGRSAQQYKKRKRIQKCQVKREHISHQKEKERISMALESAWQP